jgi:3-deoxy-D-manno-octulosonic-acid transferase
VIVGRYHEQVRTAVESIVNEGGGVAVNSDRDVVTVLERWVVDPHLQQVGAAGERAVARAAGAAERGIGALREWGLAP